MAELEPGARFGDYELERPIGRGAMGVVWLATDPRLGRRVALKFLPPELAGDATFRTRFVEESRLAASLDHPNIIPVHEAGERDGRLFIAMRYVPGSDLEALLRTEGPLDPPRALRLLRGVASGLDAAHATGLVHRDVKPGNVLVAAASGEEHAYLSDFGLTKRLGSGSGLTSAGQIVGSVGYIAPEQIEGGEIDGRADVYSLGCLLYSCLAGRPPFDRASDVAVLWAHVHAEPPVLSGREPHTAGLNAVIARAMAKRPEDRYPTATAVIEAAEQALMGRGPALAGRTGRPGGSGRRPAAVVLGGVVAALLVAVALGLALTFARGPATSGPGPGGSALSPTPTPAGSPTSGGSVVAVPSPILLALKTEGPDGFQQPSGHLVPGATYEMAVTRPRTRFTVPGPRWIADRDYVDGFNLGREAEVVSGPLYDGYFSMGVVQVVFDGPCAESPTRAIPQDPVALIEFLVDHPTVDATSPVPVNFGTSSGLSTELTIAGPPAEGTCEVPDDVPDAARARIMARTYLFLFGQDNFHISPGERIRVVAVDVGNRLVVLMYGTVEPEAWDGFAPDAERLLQSIQFAP